MSTHTCALPCCASMLVFTQKGIFSVCLSYHALFTHRHECKMKRASVIEYLLSIPVRVVLEHSGGGAALTGCRSGCWRGHGWNNDGVWTTSNSPQSVQHPNAHQCNQRFQISLSVPSCILKLNFIARLPFATTPATRLGD